MFTNIPHIQLALITSIACSSCASAVGPTQNVSDASSALQDTAVTLVDASVPQDVRRVVDANSNFPAVNCGPREAAIVVAVGQSGVVAFDHAGTWSSRSDLVTIPASFTTYIDQSNDLGVFWTEPSDPQSRAHFASSQDGATYTRGDSAAWDSTVEPKTVGPSMILVRQHTGMPLIAAFDPDGLDWLAWLPPVPIYDATASGLSQGQTITAVGFPEGQMPHLCDVSNTADNRAWGPVHCRDDVSITRNGDIPTTPPVIVTAPNGDVIVVYRDRGLAPLFATFRRGGVWSVPAQLEQNRSSIMEFTVTTTRQNDVLVSCSTYSDGILAFRYSPDSGWGPAIVLDPSPSLYQIGASAPGICGDDALVTYSIADTDHRSIGIIRIRGTESQSSEIATLPDPTWVPVIHITTRLGL